MKDCLIACIRGRVQGVGFRYHTQAQANRLNISGWVRNCPDGSVEACICGNPTQIASMQQWLKQGPDFAVVDHIEFSAGHLPDNCNDFRIRYIT
ncbi:acylphosphatase [Mariprofundus micogutta]|uniref:Acylphosphatase n=1 Tax=Mariprofundus micogutta TaxID=1921010 RepID=A0A1L8CKY7_9PROT|nr:acylphosphatase [Mariprofundus micogutta]GAV19577.1 acylphosphatase [Mariprofundus micogutta]